MVNYNQDMDSQESLLKEKIQDACNQINNLNLVEEIEVKEAD